MPIVSIEAISVALRPMRSPKWPKIAEPTGRARKATPKVRKALSRCVSGAEAGKNSAPSTSAAAVP